MFKRESSQDIENQNPKEALRESMIKLAQVIDGLTATSAKNILSQRELRNTTLNINALAKKQYDDRLLDKTAEVLQNILCGEVVLEKGRTSTLLEAAKNYQEWDKTTDIERFITAFLQNPERTRILVEDLIVLTLDLT